jgi:hypothetical protein
MPWNATGTSLSMQRVPRTSTWASDAERIGDDTNRRVGACRQRGAEDVSGYRQIAQAAHRAVDPDGQGDVVTLTHLQPGVERVQRALFLAVVRLSARVVGGDRGAGIGSILIAEIELPAAHSHADLRGGDAGVGALAGLGADVVVGQGAGHVSLLAVGLRGRAGMPGLQERGARSRRARRQIGSGGAGEQKSGLGWVGGRVRGGAEGA